MYNQLDLWDDPLSTEKSVWKELYDLKEKQDNTRKGFFSRHEALKRELCSLRSEIEILKEAYKLSKKIETFDFKSDYNEISM